MYKCFVLVWFGLSCLHVVLAASRTRPPRGAVVVRTNTTTNGEYQTVSCAVAALPNDTSSQTIFIYPGTYNEQVYINRIGPLTIYGYTTDTRRYACNQVTIQASTSATQAGSNDASGTFRIHKDNFRMYNVDVRNDYGEGLGPGGQNQAIALSQFGNQVGLYACGFYGYQDTLYANQGNQVYLRGYIEGAIDFIFGRLGSAYFGGNTIAVKGPGYITASGRNSNDNGSYVFEHNKIVLATDAVNGTPGNVFLGRPWGAYAKVIFKRTVANIALNNTIWSIWHPEDQHTSNVVFAEYHSTGVGFDCAERPSFATILTASQAVAYNISTTVGSNYASWVDTSFLV